jgi:hypothetical protein
LGHGIVEFPLMLLIYLGFNWLFASSPENCQSSRRFHNDLHGYPDAQNSQGKW